MDESTQTADQIRVQMRDLRSSLGLEAETLVTNARAAVDWHYLVRKAPWLFVGAAGVIGYLLVPSKPRYLRPTAEQLAQLAKSHGLLYPESKRASFFSRISQAATGALIKAGMAIAAQRLNSLVARTMSESMPPKGSSAAPQRQGHHS